MEIKNWIKTHKIASIVIGIGVIIVALFLSSVLVPSLYKRYPSYYTAPQGIGREIPMGAPALPSLLPLKHLGKEWHALEKEGIKKEITIKEGSMEIESKKAEDDFAEIKSMVKNYNGYIERSTKSITNLYIRINLTLRVPSKRLFDLVDELKKKFDVKSYNINNYQVSIEKELDEFQILNKSLSDYEEIRKEIQKMDVGRNKIELLMELTEKELELKRKEKDYQRKISFQEKRGEYATLHINITQKKSPKIWPENVLNQFKDRIRRALANVIKILRDLIGGGIELFFKVIQLGVYAFIIVIVVAGFYRLGKSLVRKIIKG